MIRIHKRPFTEHEDVSGLRCFLNVVKGRVQGLLGPVPVLVRHRLYALQGRPRKDEDPVPRDPVQTHPNLRRKNAKSSGLRRGDFTSSLDLILDQTVLVVVVHAEVELDLLQRDRLLDWLLNHLQIVVHDLPSPSASTTTSGL